MHLRSPVSRPCSTCSYPEKINLDFTAKVFHLVWVFQAAVQHVHRVIQEGPSILSPETLGRSTSLLKETTAAQ